VGQVEDRATETERRKSRGEEQENEKMGGHRRVAAGGPGWSVRTKGGRTGAAGLRWDDGSWRRTEFGWQKCQLY
jgi:hypothetical protein